MFCTLRELLSAQTLPPQHERCLHAVKTWIAGQDATTNALQPRLEFADRACNDALLAFIQGHPLRAQNLGSVPLLQAAYERIALYLQNFLGSSSAAIAVFANHVLTKTDLIVVEIENEPSNEAHVFELLNQSGPPLSQQELAMSRPPNCMHQTSTTVACPKKPNA